jgi:hypothetical protein
VSFFEEDEMVIVEYLPIGRFDSRWKESKIFIDWNLEFIGKERFSFSIKILGLAIIGI